MTLTPRESSFGYLFTGLVVLLVFEPVGDVVFRRSNDRVLGLALGIFLLIAVWGLQGSRRWLRIGRGLAGASFALGLASTLRPSVWLEISTYLVVWVFIVLTIMIGLRQVFAKGAVTANHLLGAVSVYLLAGVAWALAFRIVHRLDASAFVGITVAAPSEFLYLSFVTLATLGYGDIHPLNPMARMLAYMEAVVGQFYVAVLVATLVGRYVTSRGDSA